MLKRTFLAITVLATSGCNGDSARTPRHSVTPPKPSSPHEHDATHSKPGVSNSVDLIREVDAPPHLGDRPPRRDGECPARLPVERPPDVVFGVHRIVLPHGKGTTRYGGELHGGLGVCKGKPCDVAPGAELDKIWAAFHKHRFAGMRIEPARRSPHYGRRTVWVQWSEAHCEKSDSSRQRVTSRDERAFYALFDMITQTALAQKP